MIDGEMIKHLWTHKTQDHPWLSDEELLIERGEGVWLWTQKGKKVMDAFAGLAVVNVGHGRREIAEAVAEQTMRLAYYPTTRQLSNRPAAELAAKLATLTPGDLTYTPRASPPATSPCRRASRGAASRTPFPRTPSRRTC